MQDHLITKITILNNNLIGCTSKTILNDAIRDDRIVVHYQPEINLKDGKIITLEALVRYVDTDGTPVMPD